MREVRRDVAFHSKKSVQSFSVSSKYLRLYLTLVHIRCSPQSHLIFCISMYRVHSAMLPYVGLRSGSMTQFSPASLCHVLCTYVMITRFMGFCFLYLAAITNSRVTYAVIDLIPVLLSVEVEVVLDLDHCSANPH